MAENIGDRNFYRTNLMAYARSLAQLQPTPFDKLNRILEACPYEGSKGVFVIDQRSQDAFTALGIYFIESGFQHTERILPYLMKLFRGLPKCNLTEQVQYDPSDQIPVMERFAFIVTTVINDAAFHCETLREELLSAQVDMLGVLTRICMGFRASKNSPEQVIGKVVSSNRLCFTIMPCLIGMCRAMGRAAPEPPCLISRIFPPPSMLSNRIAETLEEVEALFKEELKVKTAAYNPQMIPRRELVDYWVNSKVKHYKRDRRDHLLPYTHLGTPIPFDIARFFFGTFGSSFSQKCTSLVYTTVHTYTLQFSPVKLQALLAHADKLLDEETLDCIEDTLEEELKEDTNTTFPYVSFREILRLVFVSLIYEVLCPVTLTVKEEWRMMSPLTLSLVKDLEVFAMENFATGLRDLSVENYDACQEMLREHEHKIVDTFKLNSQTTAACVDILVWCQFDDAGADILCLKLTEKVCSKHNLKLAIGHMPINIVCLEGIAIIGENFIYGGDLSVGSLRDFLLSPSELLMTLHRAAQELANTNPSSSEVCMAALRVLRETAIEALCYLLRLLLEVDSECVQAFLASASYKVYQAEEIEGVGGIVLRNAIITLGGIAVNLRGLSKIDMAILQFYQQRFCQPVSAMDNLIIDQMGRMIVARSHRAVCAEIMKMLSTVIMVSAQQRTDNEFNNFKHVSLTVVKVLMKVVTALEGDEEQFELMGFCLDIFIHLALIGCREASDLDDFRQTGAARTMGVMIAVIAILARNMKHLTFAKPKLHKLFWDFWNYCVLLGFTSQEGLMNDEWYFGMCDIAMKSPVLICKEHLKPIIQYQTSNRGDAFSLLTQAEIRELVIQELGTEHGMDLTTVFQDITFNQCAYIITVLNLETLRVRNTIDCLSPIDTIFRYIENPIIQQDKLGIYLCVLVISEKVYDLVLAMLSQKQKGEKRDAEMEDHFIYLMVKFVDPEPKVRKVAAKFMIVFTEHFPHVMWRKNVLTTLFDLLSTLCDSLHLQTSDTSPEIVVPGTSYSVQLANNAELREEIVCDLAAECQAIVEEALLQAPVIARFHIQNYLANRCETSKVAHHNGISIGIETMMLFAAFNEIAAPAAASDLERWPASVKLNYSEIAQSLTLQCRYTGEVAGLLGSIENTDEARRTLRSLLIDELGKSWKMRKVKYHRRAIHRVCGLLIHTKQLSRRLLRAMCWSAVEFFADEALQDAVACWQWFLSAKPECEIEFFQEMSAAWCATIDRKIGLFSDTPKQTDPFAPRSESELKPNVAVVSPHEIWVLFLVEHIESAKYSSQTKIDIFTDLFYRSFSAEIGLDSYCNRHIDVLGPRFRLLSAGVSLLHGNVIQSEMSRSVLRERIYCGALDFFCSTAMCPLKDAGDLRRDISILIEFWMLIHEDRKHIKSDIFVEDIVELQNHGIEKETESTQSEVSSFVEGCSLPKTPRGYRDSVDQWGGNKTKSGEEGAEPKEGKKGKKGKKDEQDGEDAEKKSSENNTGEKKDDAEAKEEKDSKDSILKMIEGGNTTGSKGSQGEPKTGEEVKPEEQQEEVAEEQLDENAFILEFVQKRNLVLCLLGEEIEFLTTWYNPMGLTDKMLQGEQQVVTWQAQNINDTLWTTLARLAWHLSPTLAVFLPSWLPQAELLRQEVCTLVQGNPEAVSNIPQALQYLVTADRILQDSPDLSYMLTWAHISPVKALSFFSRLYPPHPTTAQFAVRVLNACPAQALLQYIPQLVQAVRYDRMGYITEFIIQSVKISQLLMHQFVWNMKTNMFRDEDGEEQDADLYEKFNDIINNIVNNLTGAERMFYETEFDFFTKMTAISGVLRHFPKGIARKKACLSEMSKIKVEQGLYLPSSPEAIIVDIDYASGAPMQSAAKAPYRAKFKVRPVGIEQVQRIATQRYGSSNETAGTAGGAEAKREMTVAVIFKVADDIRQDMLALQVLQLLKNVFLIAGIDVYLAPYRVVATAPGCGVIECVPDTTSRDQMGRQTDISLYEYFLRKYGQETTRGFQEARACFIKSWAAYSVAMFLLQVKDRHNGNLLIDEQGHYIHIDFGFLFDSSPGGNMGFEPDIKLTEEIINIMGGSMDSDPFQWYIELCVRCYLAIRPYREDIITIVSLMLDTGLPCFRGQTIKMLRSRFASQASQKDAAAFMRKIISDSYLNFRTKAYDMIQYYQNQIPY